MRRILTTGLLCGTLALSALAQDVATAEHHKLLGLDAYWKLHFRQAEAHFQAAVDANPQDAAAYYYLGYTVYKIAEPKPANDPGKRRAAELFAKAYALDPLFQPDWGPGGGDR